MEKKHVITIGRGFGSGGKTIAQKLSKALEIADRAYVLETGKISLSGDAKELMNNDSVKKAYLGE